MDLAGSDAAAGAATSERSRKSYDAFISYAHEADKAFAPVLQRGLQQLAKPWNRRRAMDVFRDETSLAASPGLWPSIRDALDASRWFILLASPEAARSHWMAEEITHWVSCKGTDHLLIVLTDGTWVWDDDSGDLSTASTACNPALRGAFPTEPKYLDMTWARRDSRLTLRNARFRDQIATLAAAISEVPKEEIEGEDVRQQRRTRRIVRAVIAALSVLVLLASALAVLFHGERQTAIQQRQEAITERDIATSGELVSEARPPVTPTPPSPSWRVSPHGAFIPPLSPTTQCSPPRHLQRSRLSPAAPAQSRRWRSARTARPWPPATHDGMAKLWNLATGQQIRSLANGHDLSFPQRAQSIFSVAFSPDGKTLATGDNDGTAELWNLATGHQIHSLTTGSNSVNSVAFSPDGKTLATGDDNGTAALWNLATGHQISSLTTGSGTVWSVAFSPDGKTLATGDDDGTARLWNLATGQQIGSALTGTGYIGAVAFSPDGKTLASGGRMLGLWNVGYLVDVLTRLCAQVGGSLTQAEWAQHVPAGPPYRNVCAQHS